MSILLNWRLWAAVALAAAGAYLHHMGYESGRMEVQSVFDAYKLQTIEQAMTEQVLRQAKESAMSAANEKVSANYVSLQTATASAVLALDRDRMRLQAIIAAGRGATSKDPGAGLQVDDSATSSVLTSCIDQYAGVVSDFDRETDKLRGLQAYVSAVCNIPEK